jgi:hypothetical protein
MSRFYFHYYDLSLPNYGRALTAPFLGYNKPRKEETTKAIALPKAKKSNSS